MEKKLDSNYTRMLRAILTKSWRQHPTKQQLYSHLPPITKTVKVKQTRHAGHCWRSRDKLISDVPLWTPSHGRAKAGWSARTYIQQPCEDIGVALRTWQKRWTIGRGGKTGSGLSVLMAWQDDDECICPTPYITSRMQHKVKWSTVGLVLCHVNRWRLFNDKSWFLNTFCR